MFFLPIRPSDIQTLALTDEGKGSKLLSVLEDRATRPKQDTGSNVSSPENGPPAEGEAMNTKEACSGKRRLNTSLNDHSIEQDVVKNGSIKIHFLQ